MNGLTVNNRNGQFVADSREVARMTDIRHDNLLAKIDGFIRALRTDLNFKVSDFFIGRAYQDNTGRTLKRFDITRKGCDMVANKMTGDKGVLFTAAYVTKFEEMERGQVSGFALPQNYKEALVALVAQVEENEQLQSRNTMLAERAAADKPKVLFADAITTSHTSILVRELATILKQNGMDVGQNRLFGQLRDKGYIIKRAGTDRNMPTQRSMDLGLFEVKETPIMHSDGRITVSKTPKVTGKGQVYFVNLFKRESEKQLSAAH